MLLQNFRVEKRDVPVRPPDRSVTVPELDLKANTVPRVCLIFLRTIWKHVPTNDVLFAWNGCREPTSKALTWREIQWLNMIVR